ncbi:MAG TPA: hypothetical protein VEM76_05240 [Anaeromyxobacteraceae bacterium]|nr:hypothetical protein [Anaeromyxobacteraceae bacterium]
MPDTTAPVSEKAAVPSTILADALRNPLVLAARRAELLQLATDRASKLAAEARTRVEAARSDTTARVQELRKASDTVIAGALDHGRAWRVAVPARLRRVAHDQLLRVALALQALAKFVEPVETAPAETAPVETPAATAKA